MNVELHYALIMMKFYFQLFFFMISKVLGIKLVYQPIDIINFDVSLDQIIGPFFHGPYGTMFVCVVNILHPFLRGQRPN